VFRGYKKKSQPQRYHPRLSILTAKNAKSAKFFSGWHHESGGSTPTLSRVSRLQKKSQPQRYHPRLSILTAKNAKSAKIFAVWHHESGGSTPLPFRVFRVFRG